MPSPDAYPVACYESHTVFFSELITGAIDIDRMERIALRVIGIDMALGGADFIEVFRYFLEAGQPEKESFNSAMRVFRGAPVSGGSAFTKDVVYVHGLMEVHTFFRWALSKQRMELCQYFFAGRNRSRQPCEGDEGGSFGWQ